MYDMSEFDKNDFDMSEYEEVGRLKFGEIFGEFFFFSAFRIDNFTNSGPKFKILVELCGTFKVPPKSFIQI